MNIYLDNASTTKIHPQVIDKMLPYLKDNYGNPSSIHSFGRKARVAVEESREIIADFINADPSEIYFTSCGTEATNLIINGIVKTEFNESGKNRIITTAGDHKATLECVKRLGLEGFKSEMIALNKNFQINYEKFNLIDMESVALVSLIHVNNEVGAVNKLGKLIKKTGNSFVHIDAVQSFGKLNLDVKELGIDSLSISAHKFYGPKGIGAAFIKSGTPMSSHLLGGGQERNRRAGTENVAGIVGFAEAVKIANEKMVENYETVENLKQYFWDGILASGLEGITNNSTENSSPYILSISFDPDLYNNDSEAILMYMDINGIAVSSGSACSSGTLKPSHVVTSAGYSNDYANGTIRFSFSPENTESEIDRTITVIKEMSEKNLKRV